MLLLDMAASSKQNASSRSSSSTTHKRTRQHNPKATPKEKKTTQQDDLESLQITFYEIESWIEKTTPVLARMTKELDKASQQFQKRKEEMRNEAKEQTRPTKDQQRPSAAAAATPAAATPAPQQQQQLSSRLLQSWAEHKMKDKSMQWTLSFQPGNSLRLETNITSIEQLVDAVRKIRVLAEEPDPSMENGTTMMHDDAEDAIPSPSSSTSSLSVWVDPLETDPATEYWHIAIGRRPQTCLENYRHCEMNLSRLTEDVSPSVLNYIGHVFWDCLHPKFTCDWYSFWDRSGDPKRNQVCIDSGLAIVFLHVIRHDNSACNNALDIAYYYYDRARESLMEFFDSPDCATLETLLNLAMFCMVCKRHSQARIYISLAFRMMLEMGMHQRSKLPTDRILRKQYLKLFMVLYYNDVTTSIYSRDPFLVMDENCDIDFYEIIELNEILHRNGEAGCNDNMVVKETYFSYLLELMRISKRTERLFRDYEHVKYHCNGELPMRWAKRVQSIEIALAQWFEQLPAFYRVDPQPKQTIGSPPKPCPRERHPMPPEMLRDQSALLLMLQYQTQWIVLHKTFLTKNMSVSPFTPPLDSPKSPVSPGQSPLPQQRLERSHAICTDAANRIVVIAELITEQYGWCVCQQFINCIYQASTIYCRNALTKDDAARQHAKYMIHRIIRVLRSNNHNYQGLPNDLTACLNEFLADHDMQPSREEDANDDDGGVRLLDQFFSCVQTSSTFSCAALTKFNDSLPNSPHMHKQVFMQANSSTHHQQLPAEAMDFDMTTADIRH
ncbi:hypothetical protein LRAMOSA09791 [Lichtheimia ramosa]|uniref:Xylanolytic transcriptional activator regulatory domain-containing protein n=1 Tax=Lichtheimia ramosa TaxID=688394 RepID=A0A077WMW1_9FUNG|nr:hypothetical protein LRAMOSA09791 [Lichtheimia ramosa]